MEPRKEIINRELDALNTKINQLTKQYNKLLIAEIDEYKGKFFKKKVEKVVKVSIFKVSTKYWSNAVDYEDCYYCEDLNNNYQWGEIDRKRNFEYERHDLQKLQEAEEITEKEYNKIRKDIMTKLYKIELKKVTKKFDEIDKNGN